MGGAGTYTGAAAGVHNPRSKNNDREEVLEAYNIATENIVIPKIDKWLFFVNIMIFICKPRVLFLISLLIGYLFWVKES